MNDDNRSEEQTPQSVEHEGSASSRQSRDRPSQTQPEARYQQYPPQQRQPFGQQPQSQPDQPAQPTYRPQTYSAQYQGQPYQQTQPQSYQAYRPQSYQAYRPQSGYSQPQYQAPQSQPQYQQYQPYQSPPQYQQPGQYPAQQYPQPQYQDYQCSSYQAQRFGSQSQYQPYQAQQPQPQYQNGAQYQYPSQLPYTQQPVQYARPASNNNYWYRPISPWQAAMSRWLANARKRFSNIGFTLAMVILVWNVLALGISQLSTVFINPKKLPMWAELLMGNGPLYVIAIPLSLLIFRSMPQVKRKTSDMGIGMFLSLMAMSFPLADIGNFIGSILSDLFSNGKAQNSIDELTQSLDPVSLLLFTVIIAPIFEEWLFRRLLIDHTQQYGEKTAILLSAFAFGMFHGNLFQFFYAFGFGLLLAYAYVRTGKLRYTIAMHMTFNFFGGFLPQMTFLAMSKSTANAVNSDIVGGMKKAFAAGHGGEVTPFLIYLIFDIVMFIVGIVVAILERKKLVFYRAPEELPRGTRVKTVLGNPGIVVFIVLCVLEMITALFAS